MGESTSTNNLLTIPYHANGGRDSLLRFNAAATHYDYDAAQRIDQYTQDLSGTSNDLVMGFDFNPSGQIINLSRSTDLYHYAGNDNKTGAYVVNGLNQYTTVNGQSYSYDANGNLTSDGTRTYTYDTENRLTAITGGSGASFEYDPLGRLFQVTLNGVVRQFLYDGDALVAEYSSSNTTPVARYVHGDRADEPWVQYTGASIGESQRVYLHTDHQSSVIAQSDGSGTALNTLRYDGYGIADTANVGRFGYTGQIWLPEVGLYYYKARMYSPALGGFLQTDPIGYKDQMNLYAYVGNDPMNMLDPSGMCSEGSTSNVCVEATAENENLENRSDVAGSIGTDEYAIAGAAKVAVPEGTDEKLGYIKDGEVHVASDTTVENTSSEYSAKGSVPSDSDAVIHGHTDQDSAGVVSQGDAQVPLVNEKPNYVVSKDRVGVTELVGGKLQFRMVKGTMTRRESREQKRQLNRQQRQYGR